MYKVLFIEENQEKIQENFFQDDSLLIQPIFYKDNLPDNLCCYNICIADYTENNQEYINVIQNIMNKNPDMTFWGTNKLCSKENIFKAYEFGFKNFVQYPFDIECIKNSLNANIQLISKKSTYEDINLKEFKNSKILVVDDLKINLEFFEELLKPFEINPTLEQNPLNALEMIKQEKFDLILLDVMMPEMTGFELAEKIKETNLNVNTPLVFITALDNDESKLRGYNLGSCAYIEKPVNPKTTCVQIYNLLKIKKLQDTLYTEKEKLDNIFKYTNSEIILTDSNFNILSTNNKFIITGLNYRNFINIIQPLNPPEVIESITNINNITDQQGMYINIKYMDEFSNKSIPANIAISKIFDNEEKHTGYLLIIQDSTNELEIQNQKETFIATLTHDLKTPIGAQIRALNLILNEKFGPLNNDLREILTEILNSCKFMQYMTDNLLTRYKSQNGQLVIVKEPVLIQEIIQRTYKNLKFILEEKNQKLNIEYLTDIKEISLDECEIERVLHNLIINAAEFTPENGSITVKVENIKDFIKISIIDTGWGIPKEEIKTIFNEYYSSAKRFRKVGHGLGLYICKKIVEGHNGKIYAKSEEGKGSEFIFTLPLGNKFAHSSL